MTAAPLPYTPAPLPPEEAERLAALRRYGLLDADPEAEFDRLARLAARLLNAPIAMVSLVDVNRQFLMARCGLDRRETSRDVAFCAHAILHDDILEVTDAQQDPRFAGNPLVTDPPFLRYYAGKPLVDRTGYRLGTLCIIDTVPRPPLTADQRAVLADLAAVVMDLIENRLRALEAESDRQQAQRVAEMKDDYLATMAHELRTPVNAVSGFGHLLRMSGAEAVLSDQQRDYLNTIVESAEYLGLLIRETLEAQAAQHEGAGVKPEPVRLGPMMASVARLIEPLAARQSVTLEIAASDEVAVWADPLRLRQVLVNLLSNAVKYNRRGGTVWLSVEGRADEVAILCRDTGKGIPQSELPHLFKAFHRVEANSDDIEGSGLGLRITKRLVAMMGGRISVDSRVGDGTTFTVVLPGVRPAA